MIDKLSFLLQQDYYTVRLITCSIAFAIMAVVTVIIEIKIKRHL